jgi:hypothetical protein
MNVEAKLEIKACKRWRRRLCLSMRHGQLCVRLMPASPEKYDAIAYHTEAIEACSVMFDPPGIDEATLIVGGGGFQIYVPRKDGELIAKTFGLPHWTRPEMSCDEVHVDIPPSAL